MAGLRRAPTSQCPPGQLPDPNPVQQLWLLDEPISVATHHPLAVVASLPHERVGKVGSWPGVPRASVADVAEQCLIRQPGHEVAMRPAATHVDHDGPPSKYLKSKLALGGSPALRLVGQFGGHKRITLRRFWRWRWFGRRGRGPDDRCPAGIRVR